MRCEIGRSLGAIGRAALIVALAAAVCVTRPAPALAAGGVGGPEYWGGRSYANFHSQWSAWFASAETINGAPITDSMTIAELAARTGATEAQTTASVMRAKQLLQTRGLASEVVGSGAAPSLGAAAAGLLIGIAADKAAGWLSDGLIGTPVSYYGDGTAVGGWDWVNPSNWSEPVYTYWPDTWLTNASWDDELDWMFGGFTVQEGTATGTWNVTAHAGFNPPSTPPDALNTASTKFYSYPGGAGPYTWGQLSANQQTVVSLATSSAGRAGQAPLVLDRMPANTAHYGMIQCGYCGWEESGSSWFYSLQEAPYYSEFVPGNNSATATLAHLNNSHPGWASNEVYTPDVVQAPIDIPMPLLSDMPRVTVFDASSAETTPAAVTVGNVGDFTRTPTTVPRTVTDNLPDSNPDASTDGIPDNNPTNPPSVSEWIGSVWQGLIAPLADIFTSLDDWLWPFHFMDEEG
jgi:hypothetical protein